MTSRRPRPRGRCSWFQQVLGACLRRAAPPSVDDDRARVHTHRRQVESAEIADPHRVRQFVPQSSGCLARSRASHASPGLLPAELPRSAPPLVTTKRLVVGGQAACCQCANHGLAVQSAQQGDYRCAGKSGEVQRMQESYEKGVATHLGPELCGASREAGHEALVGVRAGRASSPESTLTGVPTSSVGTEGNILLIGIARWAGTPRGPRPRACTETPRTRTGRSRASPSSRQATGRSRKSEDARC
jgi:hypothetical protein